MHFTCRLTGLLSGAIFPIALLAAASCDDLANLKLPHSTITAAQAVMPGAFTAPGAPANDPALATYRKLPAFCRVQGIIQPSNDSHIEFEVWLPSAGWNGKYAGVGNGGFAGSIAYTGLAAAVAAGFATSSTDTGHHAEGTDAGWAIGHREKMVDFGYRAIHETAEHTKTVVRGFYGEAPQRSYFSSCSNGGRQGLMEAQRYPADYDGIVAGAPANFFTHVGDGFFWNLQAMEKDPATYIPETKLPVIEAAVLAACDALDGLKDGLIGDPRKCHFDPGVLLCKGRDSSTCLTQPQVGALKKIYEGPRDSRGRQIYPGFLPGGETGRQGWAAWITGSQPTKSAQYAFATSGFGATIFENPKWDYRTFDFDRDVKVADKKLGRIFNATDPDLKAFKSRGGKLLLYHGWSDPALPPQNTVDYYQSVLAKMGSQEAEDFMRLYMVPGMQHCGGGPGPASFDPGPVSNADAQHSIFLSMEQWVEKGVAPAEIITTKYKTGADSGGGVASTRPLCPYPQVARYTGTGSPDTAANFVCSAPQ
jgi:Tannase and feruloyl esterase